MDELTRVDIGKLQPKTTLRNVSQWPPVNITFEDIFYTIHEKTGQRHILNGVNGQFRSHELTAIMGPSGAGKSTLLNILAGLRQQTSGTIKINNKCRTKINFRKMSRYIQQDLAYQKMLTVREAMMVAADLKLGKVITKQQKIEIIEEILELLRLTKAGDTMGHLLSGGELKRLSIALELVNNPPIVFLDEPTTGLDDLSCSQCISLLQHVARGGRTIVSSIHTPSAKIFAMFDNVYVLSDGNCIYRGPGSKVVEYLENIGLRCPLNYNPADFLIEVSCGEYGTQYLKRMITDINSNCALPEIEYTKPTTVISNGSARPHSSNTEEINIKLFKAKSTNWDQFCTLLMRNLRQIFRNRFYLQLKFYMHIFLGVILGSMFFQMGNDASKTLFNFGFCFTIVIAFMYIPLMPVLLEFPSDVQLLKREHFNQWYRLTPYYLATIIAKMPIQLGLAIMYLCMVYPLTDQPLELHRILMFVTIALLIFLVSESFGYLIAAQLNILNAMFTGPALLVPFMLLSVPNMGETNANVPLYMKILMCLSYLRFGLEGITDAIYGYNRENMICPEDEVFCPYKNPMFLRKIMGFEDVNFYKSLVVLMIYLMLFHSAAFYLIRRRVLRKECDHYVVRQLKNFVKNYINLSRV